MLNKKILMLLFSMAFASYLNAQNAWKQITDFPGDPRTACSAFSFSNFGIIGAGYDGSVYRRSMYSYFPVSQTWFQIASIGGDPGNGLERDVAAGFTLGTKGYIGTGQGGAAFLNDF